MTTYTQVTYVTPNNISTTGQLPLNTMWLNGELPPESQKHKFKEPNERKGNVALITSSHFIQQVMAYDSMIYVRSGIQAALWAKVTGRREHK